MKKEYEIPAVNITYFQTEDIITSSTEQPGPGLSDGEDFFE